MTPVPAPQGVRLRPIALPTEHGSWGFVLEPILAGILVAPSLRGAVFFLATLLAFLCRQPMKLAWTDISQGRHLTRTPIAVALAGCYAGAAVALAAAAAWASPAALIPTLIAAPFAAVALAFDLRGDSRQLLPEIAGPIALASAAATISMLGGWTLAEGCVLWSLIGVRAAGSIAYVRARLRIEYGREASLTASVALLSLAVALAFFYWGTGHVSILIPLLFLVLTGRGIVGVSSLRRSVPAKSVGWMEMIWAVVTIATIAISYRLT